jgi:hypothetical protein
MTLKNLRPGNVVFLLPVKEDGIEEDDEEEARVFFILMKLKNLRPGNVVFLFLTREGGWNRRRRRGERSCCWQ